MSPFGSAAESMMGQMYSHGIKKFIFEIIKENYSKNELAIDEISKMVSSPKSYQQLGDLLAAIYQAGFVKAVEEHKELLKQRGYEATIIADPTSRKSKSIFPQEKSG